MDETKSQIEVFLDTLNYNSMKMLDMLISSGNDLDFLWELTYTLRYKLNQADLGIQKKL